MKTAMRTPKRIVAGPVGAKVLDRQSKERAAENISMTSIVTVRAARLRFWFRDDASGIFDAAFMPGSKFSSPRWKPQL
jgi:hypothetical protein